MTGKAGPANGGRQHNSARAAKLAAQREAIERQARRRIAIAIAAATVIAIVAVVVGVLLANGGGNETQAATGGQPTAAATGDGANGATTTCAYPSAGQAAKDVGVPPTTGVDARTRHAVLSTSQGEIDIDLNGSAAPCTVNSFVYLAGKGYFDDTSCHRLTTSGIFVLQCGDPTGTGRGGPGYRFADENLDGAAYPAGTVAMANAGPGTNGSQFFLVYADTVLPPNYTPFGKVTSGLDVLAAVAAKGSDNSNGPGDGHPNVPVTITSVTVS